MAVCPQQKIAIAQLYALRVEFFWRLRRGDVPGGRAWARTDLVGGPHGRIVHFTSAPLTRRSAKLVGLGGVFIISTSGGRSPSPVMEAQHGEELKITKSSLSFHQLHRQTSSMKTSTHPALDRRPFLESPQSFSRSLRMSRAGSVAWVRSSASRVVAHGRIAMNHSLAVSIAASQTYYRELEARPMAVSRLTCCLVSWSRSRIASPEVEATRGGTMEPTTTISSSQSFFTKPLPGRVRTCWYVHAGCQAACWWRPSRPRGAPLGPGGRQLFQTSRESWLTWKRFSTNGTARTQWGYERVGR